MVKRLLVYGTGSLSEKIFEYNKRDKIFDLVGFIDDNKSADSSFCGHPVISFEECQSLYSIDEVAVFVAIGYVKCNYYRQIVCNKVKAHGYDLVNYVSPNSICFENVLVGDNILICDNVFVGHGSKIHDGVILSVGTTLSHENEIGEFSFLSSCVVLGGHARVRNNCFVGLHSTVRDSVIIEAYNIIGSGTNVLKSTVPYSVTIGNPGVSKMEDTCNMSI